MQNKHVGIIHHINYKPLKLLQLEVNVMNNESANNNITHYTIS